MIRQLYALLRRRLQNGRSRRERSDRSRRAKVKTACLDARDECGQAPQNATRQTGPACGRRAFSRVRPTRSTQTVSEGPPASLVQLSVPSSTTTLGSVNFEAFLRLRPFAFHTTAASNLKHLREVPQLESARRIFQRAGRAGDPQLCERRTKTVLLEVDGREISIRDQEPLARGSIDFEDGWDFARLVELLTGLVFFWPGNNAGPIVSGRRHFARYHAANEALSVLRIPTCELISANAPRQPLLSSCNSGSPRSNPKVGKGPRGSCTFLSPAAFERTPGKVVEIVFGDTALLPESTEWAPHLSGPWRRLREGVS